MGVFDQRKAKILEGLHSDEPDLSPKGKADDQILDLLALLNRHQNYVTTSSCSGRAVVYLDPGKNGQNEHDRGRWLMNHHTPLQGDFFNLPIESLHEIFFGDICVGMDFDLKTPSSRQITFKFEPLVILLKDHTYDRYFTSCVEMFRLPVNFFIWQQMQDIASQACQSLLPQHLRRRSW